MPKGIEVVGGIARGLAQGYSTGARLANQRQALELREQQLGMQQDAYAREIAEAERIAAEQQQLAGLEGQQFAEQARDPQSIENIRHHLKERDPNLVRADKQHAAVTEALPHLQGALSGTIEVDGLRIPSAIGQLTMEQAPSFKAADEYIRRLETTISNIRSPEARQMYVDRQWGILENNAFQREMQQVRSDYQRDIELGAGHDITEPGSDQFATNPEMAQHGFQVLDQIASLAGQSGDPRDIQAARGALLEYRQAWEHAKGQLAQKRAAAQQQVLQRQQQMAGVQALMQAGQHELAGRLLAEIEGQSANALFGSADYSQGGAAFAQSRMAGGGAMSAPTGGPVEGAGQAAAAPSPEVIEAQKAEWGALSDEEREAKLAQLQEAIQRAKGDPEALRAETERLGIPMYALSAEELRQAEFRARGQKRKREVTDPGPLRHGEMRAEPKATPFSDADFQSMAMLEEAERIRQRAGEAQQKGKTAEAQRLVREARKLEREANKLGTSDG